MTTKHVSEMSDRKFFIVLCLILPIGSFISGFVVGHLFFDSIFSFSSIILGSVIGIITFKLGYKGFKDGSNLYKALDRQDDKCFTCNKIILPDDAFYWDHKSKVFCINHNPFSTIGDKGN